MSADNAVDASAVISAERGNYEKHCGKDSSSETAWGCFYSKGYRISSPHRLLKDFLGFSSHF